MNIAPKHTRFVQRLAPLWTVMLKTAKVHTMVCRADAARPLVKRAGRNLTQQDNEELGKSALMRGGEQNVNIQFGFLGGFGGAGVPGESTG